MAADDAGQGGLAGTVGAEQRVHLATSDRQGGALERPSAAEGFLDAGRLQRRRGVDRGGLGYVQRAQLRSPANTVCLMVGSISATFSAVTARIGTLICFSGV